MESVILESKANEQLSTNDIKLKGFVNDWLGLLMVFYTGIVSLAWLILLLVISLDYYGYVKEKEKKKKSTCIHSLKMKEFKQYLLFLSLFSFLG